MTDTELLNFLDSCTKTDWLVSCREASTDRGWRLHPVTKQEIKDFRLDAFSNVRDAIRHFAELKGVK